MIAILGPIGFMWAIEPNRLPHFDFFQIPNESNRTLLNTLDCVRLGSAAETKWNGLCGIVVRIKILLCAREASKNTCYAEVTQASKNLLLIFYISHNLACVAAGRVTKSPV